MNKNLVLLFVATLLFSSIAYAGCIGGVCGEISNAKVYWTNSHDLDSSLPENMLIYDSTTHVDPVSILPGANVVADITYTNTGNTVISGRALAYTSAGAGSFLPGESKTIRKRIKVAGLGSLSEHTPPGTYRYAIYFSVVINQHLDILYIPVKLEENGREWASVSSKLELVSSPDAEGYFSIGDEVCYKAYYKNSDSSTATVDVMDGYYSNGVLRGSSIIINNRLLRTERVRNKDTSIIVELSPGEEVWLENGDRCFSPQVPGNYVLSEYHNVRYSDGQFGQRVSQWKPFTTFKVRGPMVVLEAGSSKLRWFSTGMPLETVVGINATHSTVDFDESFPLILEEYFFDSKNNLKTTRRHTLTDIPAGEKVLRTITDSFDPSEIIGIHHVVIIAKYDSESSLFDNTTLESVQADVYGERHRGSFDYVSMDIGAPKILELQEDGTIELRTGQSKTIGITLRNVFTENHSFAVSADTDLISVDSPRISLSASTSSNWVEDSSHKITVRAPENPGDYSFILTAQSEENPEVKDTEIINVRVRPETCESIGGLVCDGDTVCIGQTVMSYGNEICCVDEGDLKAACQPREVVVSLPFPASVVDDLTQFWVWADSTDVVKEILEINNTKQFALENNNGEICPRPIPLEICGNNVDDDGDELIDENPPCGTETCGNGLVDAGEDCVSCPQDMPFGYCKGGPCNYELCGNNIDDDCDGLIDEGCEPECGNGAVDVGENCETCPQDMPPGYCDDGCDDGCCDYELCGNELDDDCDGLIDEGCGLSTCGNGVVDHGEDCDFCPQDMPYGFCDECIGDCCSRELCRNGIDDDCDGLIDPDPPCSLECGNGIVDEGETCETCRQDMPPGYCEEEQEICGDHVDNNDNGFIDEGCEPNLFVDSVSVNSTFFESGDLKLGSFDVVVLNDGENLSGEFSLSLERSEGNETFLYLNETLHLGKVVIPAEQNVRNWLVKHKNLRVHKDSPYSTSETECAEIVLRKTTANGLETVREINGCDDNSENPYVPERRIKSRGKYSGKEEGNSNSNSDRTYSDSGADTDNLNNTNLVIGDLEAGSLPGFSLLFAPVKEEKVIALFEEENSSDQEIVSLFFCADSDNLIPESNELDNCKQIIFNTVTGEICGNCIDDDGDGEIEEGCSEICGNSVDDDCDGLLDEGCEEECNGVDDDGDGLADENLKRQCGSSTVGVCRFGFENCKMGNWVDCSAVESGIEYCDGLDDDCDGEVDNDCEVLEQLILEYKEKVYVNENQLVSVKSAITGERLSGVEVRLVSPSGESYADVSKKDGFVKFKVKESGDYRIVARLSNEIAEGNFEGLALSTTVLNFFSSSVKSLFGAGGLDSPWLFLLLILLSAIAGILAYKRSKKSLEKAGIASTKIEQRRIIAAIFSGAIFFFVPIAVFRFYGISGGIFVALLEIALVFSVVAYYNKRKSSRKIKI